MIRDGKRQGATLGSKVLIEYLIPRTQTLVVVDHPWLNDPDRTPLMEVYSNGKAVEASRFVLPKVLATGERYSRGLVAYIIFKVIDFVSSVALILRAPKPVDVYVGMNSINTSAGLLLKRMGRVRSVIYYCFDIVPGSSAPALMGAAMGALDRFCFRRADVVWNDWRDAEKVRKARWRDAPERPQIWAPVPSPPPDRNRFHIRMSHDFIYIGRLEPLQGVQVALSALPAILNRVPDAHFHIVGAGILANDLVRLASTLGIEKGVTFHGFMPDDGIEALAARCRLGVAPYTSELMQLTDRQSAESSKTRYYAYLGLPVVFSSSLPSFADVVKKFHAGLVAEPKPEKFADAICQLLLEERMYEKCLLGAMELAESFSAGMSYDKAFSQSLDSLPLDGGARS